LSFVDRLIVGLLIEPIKADLNLSDTQISLVHGFSFAVFYTVFGLVMGRLADTVNRRNLIAFGVFTWSLLTMLCGIAKHFLHLLGFRVGVGIGEAALTPAAYSIITDYFPPEKRSTALSLFSAGVYFGIAGAFTGGAYIYRAIDAWLTERGGLMLPLLGEMQTWQLVFMAVGAPGLIMGAMVLTIREPKRQTAHAEVENASEAPSF
jgi:MFS family permease